MGETARSPILGGGGVRLRPFTLADAAARREWGWHAAIERNYGAIRATGPMTDDEVRAWAQDVTTRPSDTFWALEVDGMLVGHAMLHAVDRTDRRARFAIGMFSPDQMGRGTGTTATRLVLRHAFDTIGLHRVDLRVLAYNAAAIACYRRCGFVEEGRERETCLVGDQWHDDLVMAILDREFRAADAALPALH